MDTKEEVKRKQVKSTIDYKGYYINYLSTRIQGLLKELREINNMPDNLIREKIVRERIQWAEMEKINNVL